MRVLFLCIAVLVSSVLLPACAGSKAQARDLSADEIFVALRDAARANEAGRVADLAARLPANFDIPSYVEYYKLRARMFEPGGAPRLDTPDADIRAFLDRWQGEAIADRLRNDWLLALGRQRKAAVFEEQYPRFVLKDDTQVACYALAFRAQRVLWDEGAQKLVPPDSAAVRDWLVGEARPLLRDAHQYRDGCLWLIETYAGAGVYTAADLWSLVRTAYDQNVVTAGRRVAQWIEGADQDAIERVAERAKDWLAKAGLKTPAQTQIAMLALVRLARSDPETAAAELQRLAPRLDAADRADAWSRIGVAGARRTRAEAAGWFRQANAAMPDAALDDDTLAWAVRAALRVEDWELVLQSIERMSTASLDDPAWVYWRARALRQTGAAEQADALLRSIAADWSFYGRLAGEELGLPIVLPARPAPVTAAELAPMGANAGLARALRFYALDLRFEGNREWNWQLRGMTDRQLLAAAEFARSKGAYDRAINTAERTRGEHDFSLRFLAPYRETLAAQAGEAGLDDAWVYGLVRQESRFVAGARSGAGAHGLMQVMPATAKWVARRIGLAGYQPRQVGEVQTNVMLGTRYLRMVYDDLDASYVLASAAYNAGPGRSRLWRSTLVRPVEGAVFVETIPFNETRDYVKKVLTNAVYYATLFEGRSQSLKERLGRIAPKEAGTSTLP